MKVFLLGFGSLAIPLVAIAGLTTKRVPVSSTEEFRASLAGATAIHVYEGLPHQNREKEFLLREVKRKDVTRIADFPFYTPKIEASGKQAIFFRETLADGASYTEFLGEKLCGGFHPDYAIRWSENDHEHSILICFGCHEALIVSGGGTTYRYDLTKPVIEALQKKLSSFRNKRPQ